MEQQASQSLLRDLFVGRQAICNAQLGVHAYELLFRSAPGSASIRETDADVATSEVILAAFQDIGIDRLAGERPVAINLSAGLLDRAANLPVPPRRVIFDLPSELARPESLPALRNLKARGFKLALDDFRFDKRLSPIYALMDIIKIDARATETPTLARLPRLLHKLGALAAAKKVETMPEYEAIREMGFDLFQGYFLSQPHTMRARKLPPNRLAVLRLLAIVYDPESETQDIQNALGSDPALSYKLLRLINSAFFNPPRNINSLQDAIVLLGRRRLATWVALTSLGRLDDRPPEIFRIALARAKMCEQLAEHTGRRGGDGFVVGLFSAFNLLLEQPLAGLLDPLPIAASLKRAILTHEGPLGVLLDTVQAYERNRWRDVANSALPMDLLREVRIDAIAWAASLSGLLREN